MSEQGIYNPVTDELRVVTCPAGDAIGAMREQRMPNTPGVNCRITHDGLSIDKDMMTLRRWCCHDYEACPVWQFDKHRIWDNRKSLGDEDEMKAQNERTWREDLTGSEYGDTSFMEVIDEAVSENEEVVRRTGVTTGTTGVNLEIEP